MKPGPFGSRCLWMQKLWLPFALVMIVLSGCGSQDPWTTDYSGKHEDENRIHLNLDQQGAPFLGPCGVNRKLLASYWVDLSPIKHEYKDTEIHLVEIRPDTAKSSSDVSFVHVATKGAISFNENYSTVTVKLQIADSQNHFTDFKGNGEHKFKP